MNITPAVYRRIIAAKLYMDQNCNETIDLHVISRKACISRFHFHRLFTRIYNRTPHQYLTKKRIALAGDLLAANKLSISEICHSVGFESMGSFCILFKKETGMSPGAYRKRAILKKEQALTAPAQFVPHCFLRDDQFVQQKQ